jgi:hypothetical protein
MLKITGQIWLVTRVRFCYNAGMIAVESLLFLLGGIVLAILLMQLFGRPADGGRGARVAPVVKLMRMVGYPDNHEELRLLLNEQVIQVVSDEGLRQEVYAAETERLEALATSIAAALDVNVELARVDATSESNGIIRRSAEVRRKERLSRRL